MSIKTIDASAVSQTESTIRCQMPLLAFADRDPEAVLQARLCTTRLDASSQRGSVFTRVASTEHIVMQTIHGYQISKTHGARPRGSRRHDAVDVCRVVVPDRVGSTSNQALEGVP